MLNARKLGVEAIRQASAQVTRPTSSRSSSASGAGLAAVMRKYEDSRHEVGIELMALEEFLGAEDELPAAFVLEGEAQLERGRARTEGSR